MKRQSNPEERRQGVLRAAEWHQRQAAQLDGNPRRDDEHPTDFAMRRVKAEWHRESAKALKEFAEGKEAPTA